MSDTRYDSALVAGVVNMPSIYGKVSHVEPMDFTSTFHQAAWGAIQRSVINKTVITPETLATIDKNVDADRLRKICDQHGINPERTINAAKRLVDRRRGERAAEMLKLAAQHTTQAVDGTYKAVEGIGLADGANWQSVVSEAAIKIIKMTSNSDAVQASILRDEILADVGKGAVYYPSGIARLDAFMNGGFQPGKLYAVGARTKVGKTVFATSVSYNLELIKVPHSMVTLERHQKEIEKLKVARSFKISAFDLNRYDPSTEADPWDNPLVGDRYCTYEHKPGMTIDDVRTHVMHQVIANGAKLVFIDYWQLIQGRARNETMDAFLSRVSQILQSLAVDLDVSLVVMVQLNDFGVPKDSTSIKEACNTFMIIHRDNRSHVAYLEVQANNIGPEHDIGAYDDPCLTIDRGEGPHFRTYVEADRDL